MQAIYQSGQFRPIRTRGKPQLTARRTLEDWAARLRHAADLAWAVWPDRATDAAELVRTFRDEAGHRRAVDEPFLRTIYGLPPAGRDADDAPDVAAWRAAGLGWQVEAAPPPGPLTPIADQPIEIWTETELCVLHAAWRAARVGADEAARRRCLDAAAWHLEHTQADNATNHPWGLHVFVVLGVRRPAVAGEAMFHVDQLLHNSMLLLGRPDRLSAHILEDAAQELVAAEQ